MTAPYVEPKVDLSAFNCPHCGAFAKFLWGMAYSLIGGTMSETGLKTAQCTHCSKWTVWVSEIKGRGPQGAILIWRMAHPLKLTSPAPSKDLPEVCSKDYIEARLVLPYSPRAAAALLRLCIQRLSKELGGKGDNLNDDISLLVKKGLDQRIQKALDIVRVTGNNAVHPGEMSLDDNPEVAGKLFTLVNMIVDEMITKPNELNGLYAALPPGALEGIEKRDAQKK